jgi:hypothetical protein
MKIAINTIPVPFDHFRKLLIGLQTLPLECLLPVVEEPPRPAFGLVTPQLTKGFL